RPDFVERIRLHQLVTGSDDAVVDFATVLHPDVRLVVDTAERIDAADRSVALASGGTVSYDHLIYAVGSNAGPSTVPGVGEFAYSVTEFEDAQRLRRAVDARPCDAPITVVGAGPTGLEMAAELAEQGRTVTLVGDAIGPYLSEPGWRAVAKRFRRLGVRTVEARVAEVRADAVLLADGRRLDSAVTVWTAGFAVPDLAARSGLSTDAIGRLRTDETLTSVDDDRIGAAGDAAAPRGPPQRGPRVVRRLRRAGSGRAQRAEHRRDRPVAHRRDPDQRRRRPHRGGRGRRRTVGAAAADELPGRRPAGGAGRRHRAEPDRRGPAGPAGPGVRRAVHQPGPRRRHHPVGPPRRHRDSGVPVRARRRLGQGAGVPGHHLGAGAGGPQARRVSVAQGRQAAGPAGARRDGGVMTGSGAPSARGDEHAERFTHLRPLLFTIAYEILGSATEADDVLQESYLRWAEVDLAAVRDTKSYLAKLVSRQALNARRAGARRREAYVGPWLPEPLLLEERDASADVVLAESVSMAMMVVLESLTPDERAVFVLREVFGFEYGEIATTVGKSVTAVRQIAHR